MDLKPYVGQRVLIQFKQANAWLMARVMDDGEMGIITKVRTQGQVQSTEAVPSVFIDGLVSEDDGHYRIAPDGGGVEVEIAPETIFTITRKQNGFVPPPPVEPSRIHRP